MSSITAHVSRRSILVFGLLVGLAGLFAHAKPAIAQGRTITAGQVTDRETLKAFVVSVADSLERINDLNDVPGMQRALRNEGDWKQGDLYLVILSLEGVVIEHGGDPYIVETDISGLEDDTGKKVVQEIIAVDADGSFIEYTWDDLRDPDDEPDRVAFAIRYTSGFGVGDYILAGGFHMAINDPEERTLPDPPAVRASDVVDRETLKAFVKGSIQWYLDAVEEHDADAGAITIALREEGGPFREGAIYLFIVTTEGYVFFHGADRTQEGEIRIDLEDLNGVRFIEELIEAATTGAGFVEYHYDDPSIMGDEELGSFKVSYAELMEVARYPGQHFVVGAGFYRRPVDDVPEITLAVSPAALSEGGDNQEVVVTATLSEEPVPVATIIDLFLEGSATSDDYDLEGTLEIIIPRDAASASTSLTLRVFDDGTAEGIETVVVRSVYEGNDLASATIALTDSAQFVTAADVVDRETLRSFVTGFRDYLDTIDTADEAVRLQADIRSEGIWRVPGMMYFVLFHPDGTVFLHADDPTRDGIDASNLEDDNGVLVVRKILETAAAGGGFVDYTWDDPDVEGVDPLRIASTSPPDRVAYAIPYALAQTGQTWVVAAGFNQYITSGEESELPEPPAVWARDVMDRETLRSFVKGAASWSEEAFALTGSGPEAPPAQIGRALREEDGPWKHGAVYLFIYRDDGVLLFHGANSSLENVNLYDHQDLNGVFYTREIIMAAQAGGGFVEYYFDNPDVVGDEASGSPKVSYAETATYGGTEYIIGSGIYFDVTEHVPDITLTVSPAAVSEAAGAQPVTVTATRTGLAIPVAVVIPLSLSGTAAGDDYSVSGNLSISIPGGETEGSTGLTITPVRDYVYELGDETIIFTALFNGRDLGAATLKISDAFEAPAVSGVVPPVTLEAGDSETIDAGALFSGTSPTYSVSSSDNGVAEAVLSGATLSVTGVRKGSATVTLSARNAAGEASLVFGVTVTAVLAERETYTDILAAMGRGMLSSVSTTVGGRFTGGGQGVVVGGRRIDGPAAAVSALADVTGHRNRDSSREMALMDGGRHRDGGRGDYLLRSSAFSYAFDDQAAGDRLRWGVWGAGDWQRFKNEPADGASFDGNTTTAYLGVDLAARQRWMAGIALSYTMGRSDYDVAVASGSLEASLASVLPYARWSGEGCCTEVWTILGLGSGNVDDGTDASDLDMRMGMAGLRSRLASSGSMGIDVVGDAGLLRVSTSDSGSAALRDIVASVQRMRIGLEGSRSASLGGGATATPYVQVAGRHDGGDGRTGQGLEVSGGLRLAGNRIGVHARGRFLAVHTGQGYSEHGFSLVAFMNPDADGRGLMMSVAPRVGAGAGDSGMMWRDRPLAGSDLRGRNDAHSLRTEVGYGLASSAGVLFTSFGEMNLYGDERRQVRIGTRVGTPVRSRRSGSLELSGSRVDQRGGPVHHRIGLIGRISF
ncbi:MAG: autotransporter domain-containing protein [Gemmatimonadetes bacterium]|nr:autotransporter domain-containing protein [Gemmatimonadota bacterium]MYG84106.1 autotransporter domain-containing protein [Gemmatimonadota bacterium]MYJ89437.1 autotransporter domain-containing protein [Gemmatimonadota bacterium]